jgi:hypothetical protein
MGADYLGNVAYLPEAVPVVLTAVQAEKEEHISGREAAHTGPDQEDRNRSLPQVPGIDAQSIAPGPEPPVKIQGDPGRRVRSCARGDALQVDAVPGVEMVGQLGARHLLLEVIAVREEQFVDPGHVLLLDQKIQVAKAPQGQVTVGC